MATGKPLAVGVLLLACVAYCHAAISFPGVPFPFTDKQKHSVLATHHAVVGKGTALKVRPAGCRACRPYLPNSHSCSPG